MTLPIGRITQLSTEAVPPKTMAYRVTSAQDVQSPVFQQEGHMARPRKNKPGYVEPESQPYIGIRTAMTMLKLSKTAVVKIIDDGFIPSAYQADKPGGVWIMLRSEVEQIQKERKSNRE